MLFKGQGQIGPALQCMYQDWLKSKNILSASSLLFQTSKSLLVAAGSQLRQKDIKAKSWQFPFCPPLLLSASSNLADFQWAEKQVEDMKGMLR